MRYVASAFARCVKADVLPSAASMRYPVPMTVNDDRANRFFETFAAKNATGDMDGLLRLFASTVMIAGPNGTTALPSNAMAGAIRSRKQRFDALGLPSATVAQCNATALSDRYTLARAEWRFDLSRLHSESVTLSSTYVLEHSDDGTRIIFYLNEHDIMAVLRERGIVTE